MCQMQAKRRAELRRSCPTKIPNKIGGFMLRRIVVGERFGLLGGLCERCERE
jgi:hypothetical protein